MELILRVCFGFRVVGFRGFRVLGVSALGFGVWGLGFGVLGLGFRGFRVGLRLLC